MKGGGKNGEGGTSKKVRLCGMQNNITHTMQAMHILTITMHMLQLISELSALQRVMLGTLHEKQYPRCGLGGGDIKV